MKILDGFRNVFKIPALRNRILFTLFLLVVFLIGSHVVVPGFIPQVGR